MNKKQLTKFREDYTKFEAQCYGEGMQLAVHFDEKDDVKRMGGRWQPAPNGAKGGFWWMPEDKLLKEVHDNGTLVRDVLNDSKQIVGQYGRIDQDKCNKSLRNCDTMTNEYALQVDGDTIRFEFFEKSRMVCVLSDNDPEGTWMSIEDARHFWDGYTSNNSVKRIA
jgi:predicted RNA-binding protein